MSRNIRLVANIPLDHSPAVGGTQRYTLGLAEALVAAGQSVTVCGIGPCAPDTPYRCDVVYSGRPSTWRYCLHLPRHLGYPGQQLTHVQLPMLGFPYLWPKRGPLVVTVHGDPHAGVNHRRGGAVGALHRCLSMRVLAAADAVTFVDEENYRRYLRECPTLESRASVIPVGVDLRLFHPGSSRKARIVLGWPEAPMILFVGRFSPEKRAPLLVEALAHLHAHGVQARLMLIGAGPEEETIRQRILNRQLGHAVRLLPPQPPSRIALAMRAANLLVLCSEYEGLPTVAIEAMACGCPVAATRVGGLPALITTGITGEWIEAEPHLMAETFAGMLRGKDGYTAGCLQRAAQYGWPVVTSRMLELYAKVTGAYDKGEARGNNAMTASAGSGFAGEDVG